MSDNLPLPLKLVENSIAMRTSSTDFEDYETSEYNSLRQFPNSFENFKSMVVDVELLCPASLSILFTPCMWLEVSQLQ